VNVISSAANPYVKRLRSLCSAPRERRNERSFVIEGVRLVSDALDAGVQPQLALYAPDQLQSSPGGAALLDRVSRLPQSFAATMQAVAAAADTRNPQGIVAAVPWIELEFRAGLLLVLDAIRDPGNVGTLLRSAEAAGVGGVCCINGTADIYNPKVVRSAMGAHFTLPIRNALDWDDMTSFLTETSHVYAAIADATMPYFAVDWCQPAALIIGSEAHGVSAEGLQHATQAITIPMVGRTESLNAGVAGSIILFEALRQRSLGHT
jgi:TrmH family RNA methyltransferase